VLPEHHPIAGKVLSSAMRGILGDALEAKVLIAREGSVFFSC